MRLVYPEWEEIIEFQENRIPVVVIEAPKYFRRITGEICDQIRDGEGRFVISENDNEMELKKHAQMILSPFAINTEDGRIVKRIYKQLEEVALEEELQETKEVNGRIIEYLYKLMDYYNYDLSCDENIDLQMLFKCAGIRPSFDSSDVLQELVEYCELVRDSLGIRLFIICNFRMLLEREELESFYNTIVNKKISILLLENTLNGGKIDCEDVLTIDSDLCEL